MQPFPRIVQDGTGAQLWLHEAKKKIYSLTTVSGISLA